MNRFNTILDEFDQNYLHTVYGLNEKLSRAISKRSKKVISSDEFGTITDNGEKIINDGFRILSHHQSGRGERFSALYSRIKVPLLKSIVNMENSPLTPFFNLPEQSIIKFLFVISETERALYYYETLAKERRADREAYRKGTLQRKKEKAVKCAKDEEEAEKISMEYDERIRKASTPTAEITIPAILYNLLRGITDALYFGDPERYKYRKNSWVAATRILKGLLDKDDGYFSLYDIAGYSDRAKIGRYSDISKHVGHRYRYESVPDIILYHAPSKLIKQ